MDGVYQRTLATCVALLIAATGALCARDAHADPGVATGRQLPPPVVRSVPRSSADFVRTAGQPTSAPMPPPAPPAPPMPTRVDAVPLPSAGQVVPVPARQPVPAPSNLNWTTPPEPVPPAWSTPAPVSQSVPRTTTVPAPPPPPTTTRAVTSAPVPLSERCWTGCGLPCEQGISRWHARLVGGVAFYEGTDTPDQCGYLGFDLGRTHCGCWGYDLYYRWSSARFDRQQDPRATGDGGYTNHLGAKLTWEKSIANSRFYGWVGVGGGYFWTEDYLDNDDGWEAFGELGVGYVLSANWRVRLGVNVHYMDTSVARLLPANDGQSRDLWLIAPVAEVEFDF